MDIATVQWLLNFGAAGIVVVLIVTGVLVPGWVHKNLQQALEKTQDALALERERNHGLQQIAQTGTQAMTALAQVAEEQRHRRRSNTGDQPVSTGGPL